MRKELESKLEVLCKDFVNMARGLSLDLNGAASTIEAWRAKGDPTAWPGINSMGIVQGAGARIDGLAAVIDAYHQASKMFDEYQKEEKDDED